MDETMALTDTHLTNCNDNPKKATVYKTVRLHYLIVVK